MAIILINSINLNKIVLIITLYLKIDYLTKFNT